MSEFETESHVGDDELEEVTEEVAASRTAPSPPDRSLPQQPGPLQLADSDIAASDKGRAVPDDTRAESGPVERAPPALPAATEQHVPNEVVHADLEATAQEEPTQGRAPQSIAAVEPPETPVPVPMPTEEASSLPATPVEQSPAEPETEADEPSHKRIERETTRVVRVRAETTELKGKPVEVVLRAEAPALLQSTRVIRVPSLVEKPDEEPRSEDQATAAVSMSAPEPQPSTVEEKPDPPAKSVLARTERVQRRRVIEPLPVHEKPERNLVEIHIGRIEVKPPEPAPRPVAKPRVGRLNLDDVLNRRRTEKR